MFYVILLLSNFHKISMVNFSFRYYLLNLIKSDDHNISVFRLISLLLENRTNQTIKKILETDLTKIPTHKFIDILPQIIPHISTNSPDLFSQTINKIVEKCAKDHPYHTLPLILSLVYSYKDREYTESKAVVNDARTQSAKALLNRLKNDTNLAALIKNMEYVFEALIQVAYCKSGDEDKKLKLPRSMMLRNVVNFDTVLVPTYSLAVEKNCDYKNRIVGKGFK